MTLLEKFGIKVNGKFTDYNLIGIDFGDGEISAAFVHKNTIKNKIEVKGLSLDETGTLWKNVNAFFIGNSVNKIVYSVTDSALQADTDGIRYYNYKKSPADIASKNKFIKDDDTVSPLSYREVMCKSFNQLVNILFKSNPYSISNEKPTIILVGRPSGPLWETCENEYAEMLQNSLVLPNVKKPVYVAIQAESTAALAREIDPKWDSKRISNNEIVIVLDNGSSTFDVTVIASGGVVGEASFQFGGNLIDANMLKLLKEKVAKDCPGKIFETKHGQKLALRIKKESFYGKDGNVGEPQLYSVGLRNNNGNREQYDFKINEEFMFKVLNEVPVKVTSLKRNSDGTVSQNKPQTYASWMDACKNVYEGFYQQFKHIFKTPGNDDEHPFIPDRIILSGGVSVMPEVQKVIEEVFGKKPTITDRPNFSVSEGLAYVLGSEIQKQELLEAFISKLPDRLPDAESLREEIIKAGIDEEWICFEKAIAEWVARTGDRTIPELVNLWKNKYFIYGLKGFTNVGTKKWYENNSVKSILSKMLKESFEEMFPTYIKEFRENLPDADFSELKDAEITIKMQTDFFFGNALYNSEYNQPLTKAKRNECYRSFLNKKEIIRNGGSYNYEYNVSVEKGFFTKKTVIEKRTRFMQSKGIRGMYDNPTGITPKYAASVRDEVIQILREPLKYYVESITPYFNMTARQSMDTY